MNMQWMLDKIERTPSFVEELKNYELEGLLLFIKSEKQRWLKEFYSFRLGSPDEDLEVFKKKMFYSEELEKFDRQSEIVKDEQQRRISTTTAPAKNKGVEKNTTGKTKVPTQAQLAVFYRTMLQLDAYPVFTANGRTAESNYKEIGARHGLSSINFKKHFLDEGIRPFNTMGELINALTFEVVETLIQMLPEKEKALDLLKIEKAKQ